MPFTVCLNGFAPDVQVQQEEIRRLCPRAEIILLDASSCDTASAPEAVRLALTEGRHEDAARWFAMQYIHMHGGFYAAPGSYVLDAADALRYETIFFSEGFDGVSLHFFGGAAGDNRWLQIMDALLTPGEGTTEARIAALVQTAGVTLLPPEKTMLPIRHSACCIGLVRDDAPVALPGDIYAALCERVLTLADSHAKLAQFHEICAQRDRFLAERDEARRDRRTLREQLRAFAALTPADHLKMGLRGLAGKGGRKHA